MTAHVMDMLRIDAQDWTLCHWSGPNVTPSSESLGFATEMESTANIDGRIDHFVVEDGRLRLSHVEANLAEASRDFVPPGGAREDITRRAWVKQIRDLDDLLRGGRGDPKAVLDTSTRVVLYFRELWIPFTGRIVAGRDFDQAKYVHAGRQRASSFRSRLLLDFREGALVARTLDESNESDDAAFEEKTQSD